MGSINYFHYKKGLRFGQLWVVLSKMQDFGRPESRCFLETIRALVIEKFRWLAVDWDSPSIQLMAASLEEFSNCVSKEAATNCLSVLSEFQIANWTGPVSLSLHT